MPSSFMGLYVQREALACAQKALDITGNNLANVKTKGYTRQRLDVASVANAAGTLGYKTGLDLAGQGVEGVGVTQIRNALLDKQFRNYNSDVSNTTVKSNVLSDFEDAVDDIESGANNAGFAYILGKFKTALMNYSTNHANDSNVANTVIGAAKNVVQVINSFSTRADAIVEQTKTEVDTSVSRINAIFKQMGSLNKQITDSYIQMGHISSATNGYMVDNDYGPLELKDQMNLLIDELSSYGNVHVTEETNGSYTVRFANEVAVNGKDYAQLATTSDNYAPTELGFVMSSAGTYNAATKTYDGLMDSDEWQAIKNGTGINAYVRANAVDISGEASISSGSLRGYLDIYNGNGLYADTAAGENDYQGLPYYKNMINALAKSITDEYNSIFLSFGFEIFTYDDATGTADFENAAANLRLSDDWINNPELIAKPDSFSGTSPAYEELDPTYINKMLGVFNTKHSYGDGTHSEPLQYTFEDYVTYYGNKLGGQVEYENSELKSSTIMLDSTETARDEVMGVSLNEEGVEMTNYQKWYNAIARMVTTIDECLDKVINGMGIVGL
jgi:flagellar hook-associated protein 1 FlgK